ncbi:hypothetical protein Leryth_010489 [Lithospermum erythrorhizon]|nr:hypothetical protein Leryth_010489 [Lithospermum erythrorhizon]
MQLNDDSDESISEEENINDELSGNWTRLGDCVEKKRDMQVFSQLDLLKETMELDSATIVDSSSIRMQNSFSHEDEIEFPAFDKRDDVDHLPDGSSECIFGDAISSFPNATCVNIPDEETISDDDENRVGYPFYLKNKLYDREGTSARDGHKAAGITYSSVKPGVSSSYQKVDEQHKDLKDGQVKHNSLMFPLKYTTKDSPLYCKGDNYSSKLFNVEPGHESNSATPKQTNKSMAELLEDVKLKQLLGHEMEDDLIVYPHPVADFPEGFQEKSDFPLSNFNKHSRKKLRNRPIAHKRSKTSSCSREMYFNNETDTSDIGQSSDDEDVAQYLKSTEAEKTMADQFQTIFGAISTSDLPNRALPMQFGLVLTLGLHEKLQCMMQNEKEIEMIFLKRLPINASSVGENQCMDVKILSRSLEARLIVCHCDLVGNKELQSFKTVNGCNMGNFGRTLTIVFSTKICTDVELEVGNLIRIHSPCPLMPLSSTPYW